MTAYINELFTVANKAIDSGEKEEFTRTLKIAEQAAIFSNNKRASLVIDRVERAVKANDKVALYIEQPSSEEQHRRAKALMAKAVPCKKGGGK